MRIVRNDRQVTPCVGVWIEICDGFIALRKDCVTPYVGVWIEITLNQLYISH